jgi:MFS family permease
MLLQLWFDSDILLSLCRSNQAKGFGLLNLAWGIGAVMGPVVSGLLAQPCVQYKMQHCPDFLVKYPFLLPCIGAAIFSVAGTIASLSLIETNPQCYKVIYTLSLSLSLRDCILHFHLCILNELWFGQVFFILLMLQWSLLLGSDNLIHKHMQNYLLSWVLFCWEMINCNMYLITLWSTATFPRSSTPLSCRFRSCCLNSPVLDYPLMLVLKVMTLLFLGIGVWPTSKTRCEHHGLRWACRRWAQVQWKGATHMYGWGSTIEYSKLQAETDSGDLHKWKVRDKSHCYTRRRWWWLLL